MRVVTGEEAQEFKLAWVRLVPVTERSSDLCRWFGIGSRCKFLVVGRAFKGLWAWAKATIRAMGSICVVLWSSSSGAFLVC